MNEFNSILRVLCENWDEREDKREISEWARAAAFEEAARADRAVAGMYDDDDRAMILDSWGCKSIYNMTRKVVEEQNYDACLRGSFFSVYINAFTGEDLSGMGFTSNHELSQIDCRLGTSGPDGTCIRELSGRSGDYYGNCPSLHAAEWLHLPKDKIGDPCVLWVEGGASLNDKMYVGTGKSPSGAAVSGSEVSGRLYRCTMCLKHSLSQGITDFAFLNYIDPPSLFFGSVPAHLAAMTIINTINDLMAK